MDEYKKFFEQRDRQRPRLEDVQQAEAVLDVEALTQKALSAETWVRVKPTDPPRIS